MFVQLRRLMQFDREERGRYWRGAIYAVVNKLFDVAPELLIGVAVDVVVERDQSFLARVGVVDLQSQLLVLGALTVMIWAGESFFQYLYEVTWRTLAQGLQTKARATVYDHVQHLRMSELESRRRGEIQTILTEDVNQLERFLNGGLVALIHVVTSTLVVGAVFVALAPRIAGFAMLPIPIIVVIAFWFQRGLAERYAAVRGSAGKLGARLTSQLGGLATIKAYNAQERVLQALNQDSANYEEANSRAIKLSSAFVPLIRMAVLGGFVVTLVYGGFRTLDGDLAVGAYSAMVFLTQRLLWPFTRLGETVDLYQRSMASAGRLFALLDLDQEGAGGDSRADYRGDIEVSEITFAYPEREPALKAVSLTIAGGAFVGLVGSTGSGKSTLAKLLLRFYDPDSGRIAIGGTPIGDVSLTELRRSIAWVGQEPFLFYGTIADNIALGSPTAKMDAIVEASKAAELHDFVTSLSHGYDTVVGDFGAKLSGGQRQRLSIARAVLKQPAILILDEATSAVDNDTEAAIQRSLKRVAVGRTVIAIAHRLSTIVDADAIFVLEDGAVVEHGRHDELAQGDGRYAKLWAMQVGHRASVAYSKTNQGSQGTGSAPTSGLSV